MSEDFRKQLEANRRRATNATATASSPSAAAGSPASTFTPSSTVSGLPPTPEQLGFTHSYGSREPFGSPSPSGSHSFGGFTSPYASREAFGSPSGTQISQYPEQHGRRRHAAGNVPSSLPESTHSYGSLWEPYDSRQRQRQSADIRPTDLSERFSSAFRLDEQTLPFGQTEPSVRPKERKKQSPASPPRAETTTLPSYEPTASYDPFSSSYRSGSSGSRSYSTGDLSEDFPQRMSELSYGSSDFQYTLRGPPPDLTRSSNVSPQIQRPRSPPSIDNRIPEPDIVYRYRNQFTGEPDPQRLRQPIQAPVKSKSRSLELANISRQNIREIRRDAQGKNKRKIEYLESRGFEAVEGGKKDKPRYIPQGAPSNFHLLRREMTPSRFSQMIDTQSPRYNKPLSKMKKRKPADQLGPVGRQGFGPLPRQSMSMPDLSSAGIGQEMPSNRELFRQRFESLKPKHQKYYENFRQQITWEDNLDAKDRMTKAPTHMVIADENKNRLDDIQAQRKSSLKLIQDRKEAKKERNKRRKLVRDRAVLPASLPDDRAEWMAKMYIQPIPEEEEVEDEEEPHMQ